jgi:CheY-like chemotaxis protein
MDNYCSRLGQLVDRKRAELALILAKENAEAAAKAAEDASRAKTEFLAKMSHEIRTPMNGVIGMTDLLSRSDLTERQRKFVYTAQQSAESLLGVINDILDFSKMEAGKFALDNADFDVRATVGEVVEVLAESAQKKGLEITYVFSRRVPKLVRGDPNRLRQIIYNIVGNAIKFTESGEVHMRVTAGDITEDSTTLEFSVRDTGIGFDPVVKDQILIPFEQADGAITRRYGGTGLGLPIARQLIQMMDGELFIDSQLGKGSIFRFSVRLTRLADVHDQNNEVMLNFTRKRVLVVDDNETNRDILFYYLTEWGAEVVSVADGRSALRALREAHESAQPFDLVLLDMVMPHMSGQEVWEAIVADTDLSSTAVIILTSMGCSNSFTDSVDRRECPYLTKPVRPTELFNQISILVTQNDARARAESDLDPGEERFSARPGPKLDVRVLLAEDNVVNQEVMLAQLAELGCHTDLVTNGTEVLAALEKAQFDIILMDCQMPEMDGFQATAAIRLREQQQNPAIRIPIIAVTANAFDGERERCLEAGMDDYISKPFNQDDLCERLIYCLDENGPTAGYISKACEETSAA